jgi:hypothetical protein
MAAAVLTFASPALAVPEAEQKFREGRTAMEAKNYDEACTKFAESQKLEPAPGTLLNLGECEEQRVHLIAAAAAFKEAASTFKNPQKQSFAQQRFTAITARIPKLIVKSATPDVSAKVNDTAVTLGTEMSLDPGEAKIHAEAAHFHSKDVTAKLVEGRTIEIDVTLESEAAPPPVTPTPVVVEKPSPLPTVGLAVAGVGVASLAVGAITGLMTLNKASTVKEHCNGALACDRAGVDAASGGSTLSLVSTITVIAGAALLAGGGTLFFIGRSKNAKRDYVFAPTGFRF